jgi:uncharacterized protein (DUF4213/DUF364 family)
MKRHEELYDLLFDYANLRTEVEQVLVGLNWTLCRAGAIGMARTCLPGKGSAPDNGSPLQGRSVAELSQWLRKWDPCQAAIGLAAVNAAINREADMVYMEGALFKGRGAIQNSFDWFASQLSEQRVVVAGDAAAYLVRAGVTGVTAIDLPGAIPPEAELLLPQAEWLFLPADTIRDKTLPRLLELAPNATCVLYGTDAPWLDEWGEFGIDYLIGSQIDDSYLLNTLISEGAGREDLASALSYRVIAYNGVGQQPAISPATYANRRLHLV